MSIVQWLDRLTSHQKVAVSIAVWEEEIVFVRFEATFTLYQTAFRSDVKTIPDRPYVYTWNAIFRAMFGAERLCSTSLLKAVPSISDGFSGRFEPSITFNTITFSDSYVFVFV